MDPQKLRRAFDGTLKTVWGEYLEYSQAGSPFEDLAEVLPLWENAGFNQELGWLTGVADVTGWSLDRPLGPKQWSPKGKHPRSES